MFIGRSWGGCPIILCGMNKMWPFPIFRIGDRGKVTGLIGRVRPHPLFPEIATPAEIGIRVWAYRDTVVGVLEGVRSEGLKACWGMESLNVGTTRTPYVAGKMFSRKA